MALPNFLCVGAQKAGTTTLYNILRQHPEIYLPDVKETKFFNEKYNRGIEFYKQFFCKVEREKAIGEIDPDYMFFEVEKVAQRIYKLLGSNVKLIFMLRNPVDRAYSHYWMNVRRGYEKETFKRAIELEYERINKGPFYKHNFSYISRGYYASQIKIFLKFFSLDNMFFIIFEDEFLKDRERVINALLRFLGVEPMNLDLDIRSNPASLPKVKIFNDILYSLSRNNFVKIAGKMLLPSRKIRNNLIKQLERINQKPFRPPELDVSFKGFLIEKYFIEEIEELEILIDRNLRIWYEDYLRGGEYGFTKM